jgi:uncharacterized SAM-binding protein YcdF (DUF218 family)
MFLFLSKLLPLLVYPLGLACILLAAALLLRRHPHAGLWLTASALLLLYLGGNHLVAMLLIRNLEQRHPALAELPLAEAIVVLGGGETERAAPRPAHEVNEAGDRLLYAQYLFSQGAAPHLLLTGGIVPVDNPGSSSTTPGAEVMASILTQIGVPREALWLEGNSRNTYENAVESKKILDRAGIRRIVLVTSALHMPRSAAIFEKQGFEVIPAPTDYLVTDRDWAYYLSPDWRVQLFNLIPTAEDLHFTTLALKEYLGILVYRLRGWL